MTFLYGTFLKIEEPEPDITAVTQKPPFDPVHPGDPVNLQCSVLFKSEKKTCSAGHSVHWFRAGPDESHPGLIYAHGNSGDGCERLPETNSRKKCVYNLSRNISSSDTGTYYCAVAACGEILFGNGAKLDNEGTDMWSQRVNAVIFLFCAVLTLSLIVLAVLIYGIKKNKCGCCNAVVSQQLNNRVLKNLQSVEDPWVCSAVIYTMMKADGGVIKDANTEKENIYPAIKALGGGSRSIYPERTYAYTRGTLKLHTESPQPFEPCCEVTVPRLFHKCSDWWTNDKMLIIFYLLLMLRVGRCTHNLMLEMKTVAVGDDVILTCSRLKSDTGATLHWVRVVSGNWPEFLGGTFAFEYDGVTKTPHFTAKQESGNFTLHISKSNLNDSGLYYCIEIDNLDLKILRGTFLRIKGSEPDITAIIQELPSHPVYPGDPVTVQCSVLFNSVKKSCPAEHSVYWFRAGSEKSHPSLIYAHENSGDGCESCLEVNSTQKCVYSFSKNITSSDAGTYHCAVAACGEIIFGNGKKLDVKALYVWDLQMANTVIILLCTVLTASVVVIFFLWFIIKKKTCACANDADQQKQQRDEAIVSYSTPTFISRKADRAERRSVQTSQGVYTDVSRTGRD
ncbi:uncharacterized protein [Leuresthes tenuis]|uniref:uncharacterized protein n=1 Tax=Leuresthes tenuis TaxID=355514 RepID=UPI003B508D23